MLNMHCYQSMLDMDTIIHVHEAMQPNSFHIWLHGFMYMRHHIHAKHGWQVVSSMHSYEPCSSIN